MSRARDFEDRVVVVTGASRGIGRAAAGIFRSRGARVYEISRDIEPGPFRIRADVSIGDQCEEAAEHVRRREPAVHALVNNAGVGAFDKGIDSASESDWDQTLAVNAKSIFLMSKAFLPLLRQARGASVVNVASVHAIATAPGVAAYAASKGAAVALTRSMAIDLAKDLIRVVAVLPGATATEMLDDYAKASGASLEELGFRLGRDQIGRVCSAEEVAEVIAFAASESASAITGSSIIADGGLLASFA